MLDAVAQALAALHGAGFVHRDVKSGNIKVSSDGGVKLLDLGLAVPPGTVNRELVGTLHYAAPEQLSGNDSSPASDVYSLGVVAYQMITGRLPFRGDTAEQVLARVRERRAKPIARLVHGVPEELEELVDDMTRADASDRPQLPEVRERLETLNPRLQEQDEEAEGKGPQGSRFRSWLRRRAPLGRLLVSC